MTPISITYETFCKAYFVTHRRNDSIQWEELDKFGKQWWESQARAMWRELEPKK